MHSNSRIMCKSAVAVLATVSLFGSSSVQAQNEGFEPPFSANSSNSIGDAGRRDGDFVGIDPTQGSSQLLLTTINNLSDGASSGGPSNQSGTNAVTSVNLAAFLGVPTTTLRNGVDPAAEGSAFTIELTLQVGQFIIFDYQFITQEDNTGSFRRDFAFVTLSLAGSLQDYFVIDSADNADFDTPDPSVYFTAGAKTFNSATSGFVVTTAGTYTLGIGVADATDSDIASALLVDNIAVVPEPSAYVLALAGLGMLLGIQRLKRSL